MAQIRINKYVFYLGHTHGTSQFVYGTLQNHKTTKSKNSVFDLVSRTINLMGLLTNKSKTLQT